MQVRKTIALAERSSFAAPAFHTLRTLGGGRGGGGKTESKKDRECHGKLFAKGVGRRGANFRERENSKEVVSAKKVLESEHRVNWPDHPAQSKRFHYPIRRRLLPRYIMWAYRVGLKCS